MRRDAFVEAFRFGFDEKPNWYLELLASDKELVQEFNIGSCEYASIRKPGATPRIIAVHGDWIVFLTEALSLGRLQVYSHEAFEELFTSDLNKQCTEPTAQLLTAEG